MRTMLLEITIRPPQLSLAPGFSRVSQSWDWENRFNGFPPPASEAVETALLPARLYTRLKPGANERPASRRRCVLQSFAFAALAAALVCAPPVFAQAPAAPAPPAPPAAPKPPATVSPRSVGAMGGPPVMAEMPRKLALFETPVCQLHDAVRMLQTELQLHKMEPLNILFAPETPVLEVSELTLRNVTGADALQLIAAVAGCTVEPMYSTDAPAGAPNSGLPGMAGMPPRNAPAVIGYMLRAKPKTFAPGPGAGVPVQFAVPGGMVATRPASVFGGATGAASRNTRIYPLGAVSSATKFPDLEKTLREIFKADGVAENQVSLALHEKTNVLVVNAAEPVHALVEQLLTALNTNTSQAARQNTVRDRAMGREELEAAARAQRRLELELAERDTQMRELQKELRKLQDAAQKPPSAK